MKKKPSQEEKLPIFCNDEAEQAVIGAILNESQAIGSISFLKPEMFYNDKHSMIFNAAQTLYDSGKSLDNITITEQLKKTGELDGVGGTYEIMQMMVNVASAANIEYHAMLIQDEYYRRSVYQAAKRAEQLAADSTQDIADVLDTVSSDMEAISSQAYSTDENISIAESANIAFQDYFEREKTAKTGKPFGIDTGLVVLNKLSAGWQNTNLMILAARPAMGKTSVMLHFAKAAAKSGKKVVIFSLEMSHKELSNKLILSESNVNANRFRNGNLCENEIREIEAGTEAVLSFPIVINDKSDTTVRRIKNNAKQLKKQGKCDVVFIDYLQLINMKQENKSYNREQEVSQTSRALKIMAKELDIPVIVLSQLSRQTEERKDKRPLLSDLRESGAIEQDADMVMFLWRPDYYDIESYENKNTKGMIILDIAKGRNMPTCEIEFSYNEQMTKFYESNEKPF